jgi:hypothetical protein
MRDYKKFLTSSIQVVTFLFCSFSGFLKRIAPPDQTGVSYAVGILSFLVLVVLLIVSAVGRQGSAGTYRIWWIVAGVIFFVSALPAVFFYPRTLTLYTYLPFDRPDIRHIAASEEYFTPSVKTYISEHPGEASPAQLERNFNYDDIWTSEGIARSERMLLAMYAWLVLTLASAIFCLLEANLAKSATGVG